MDNKGLFLGCCALVCLAALLLALSGGIRVNIYYGAQEPPQSSLSSSAPPDSAPAGEEQFFTSSPEEYSSSSFIYDPTLPYDAVYGQPGEFELEQELNTVTLSAGGAVLKNKTIHRDVLITAESGSVTLVDCIIEGSIKVTGGASVTLKGVTAERAEMRPFAAVSLTLEESEVALCDVYTNCELVGNGIGRARTQGGGGLVTIKLTLRDMELAELTVVEPVTVSLENASIEKTSGSDNIYYDR